MVDDDAAVKLGPVSASVEPLPTKSSRRTRLDEPQDVVVVNLPLNGFAYSDPSFIKGVVGDLLLSTDRIRFVDIGMVRTAEWGLAHVY